MSDFENILKATNQEDFESRLLQWTGQLLAKGVKTGLSERECQQMLWLWMQKRTTTAEMRQFRRERRFQQNGSMKGLQWASLVFRKDARTIRRWCEKGHFPGATRTAGDHWRIPPQIVEEVWKNHPNGFGRGPRRLFGTKIWRQFQMDMGTIFGLRLKASIEMEAGFQDKSQTEFLTAPVPPSLKAVEKVAILVEIGHDDYASLRHLARRLYKQDPKRRINFKLLADALKIRPSTLYRRYGKKRIRSAIRGASKPFTHREDELKRRSDMTETTEQDQDAMHIVEMFRDFVVDPDTPSPFLLKRG